jgi:D-alanyl-D-alanine carboxypeptidase (penicillin-binding protein 5/6)
MRTTFWTISSLGFGLLTACGQGSDGAHETSHAALEVRDATTEVEARDATTTAEPTRQSAAREEGRIESEPFPTDAVPRGLTLLATASATPSYPNQIGMSGAKLREVDVVHVGGQGGSKPPLIVSAVGTGAAGILSSFRSQNVGAVPTHLHDSVRLLGHDHRLLALTPRSQPKADYQVVLSGRLNQGVLWLTSFRVHADGELEQLHSVGYGSNVNVEVERYAMAHRDLELNGQERFQIVTPILYDDGRQRLVTWEVDGQTGQIVGKFHSVSALPTARSDSDLSVSFSAGTATVAPHFVVTARAENQGRLNQTLWRVTNAGVPNLLGSASSGRNIQNSANVSLPVQNLVSVPVNETGHVTATVNNGQLRLDVWEDSACLDGTCQWGPLNVSNSTRDVAPNVPGVQQANAPNPVTQNVLLRDPLTDIDMFASSPDLVQAIASVRKVMVTIVALDAVRSGDIDLDDEVTVSAAAANVNNTNASSMGLVAGEKISLRNLLYGNMMVSAGDATWAISEYVAGSLDNMITLMNNKAFALGMTNTFHCQRGTTFSAVSYSTARDQARLWESVYQDELFLEFAGRNQQNVCGTVSGQPLCHAAINAVPPMSNPAMSTYPNMDGYKTGGGGGKCTDIPQYVNTPSCASGGCLAVQSTRLGRSLILVELQPDTSVGQNDWSDMVNLSDFGFRQLFTPEWRGDSGAQAGNTGDFAIDAVDEHHALSAALTGGSTFTVCNWAADLQAGDLEKTQCLTLKVSGLASSIREPLPTRLDMVRLSTLYSEGDYLVGHLDDAALQLSLWRVGQRN